MNRYQTTSVAIIVPVLNDWDSLDRLLDRVRALSDLPDEVIVVDGAGQDSLRTYCESTGCRHVSSPPGRGKQLRAGSEVASSDVYWFLHADAVPAGNSIRLIRRSIDAGNVGGYFRFQFDGPDTIPRRALAGLINWRTRYGVPYGDQGLFVRRDAYAAAGGFSDAPLFEEVRLVRQLRLMGRFAEAPAPIGVSPRRWERDGWLRRSLENRCLATAFMLGVSPERLARWYQRPARAELSETR